MSSVILGFALAVAIEAAVLAVGLTRAPIRRRLVLAFAMNAVSHPALVFVLAPLLYGRVSIVGYATTVEILVVALESAVVSLGIDSGLRARDVAVVVMANAASFAVGVLVFGVPR